MKCVPAAILAEASVSWLGAWMCLVMQPHGVPFDPNLLIYAKHVERVRTTWLECYMYFILLYKVNIKELVRHL